MTTPIPDGDYMDVLIGGSLYTCGLGSAGQLGLGTNMISPHAIGLPTRVISLEGKYYYIYLCISSHKLCMCAQVSSSLVDHLCLDH